MKKLGLVLAATSALAIFPASASGSGSGSGGGYGGYSGGGHCCLCLERYE